MAAADGGRTGSIDYGITLVPGRLVHVATEVIESLRAGDHEEATKRWIETPLMRLPDARAQAAMREIVQSNAKIWTYSPQHRRMLDPAAVGRLGEIAVPTLILLGEDDLPETHRVAELAASSIAAAELATIAGAGHLVNLAAPAEFERAVRRFLDGAER